jgi:PAS domain S-box-containing protein
MSPTETPAQRPGAPRARHLERTLALVVLAGGLPAVLVASAWIWTSAAAPEVRWTVGGLIAVAWIAAAAWARQIVDGALHLIASLLGALREGDYSMRGPAAPSGSALALVLREVNDLGSTLHRQRTEAIESTALLTHVMEEIAVAVFAFDPAHRLLFANKAAEQLVGRAGAEMMGVPAAALGFVEYLSGEARRLIDRSFGGRRGRYEVRRAQFYREGRPHHLLVLVDLSQALREEEQAAWQRIVRVLSHEINNSLTPIKSIAHSLKRFVERAPDFERRPQVEDGLALIEERSGALSRFLRAYAQLARLPKPQPASVNLGALVNRIIELEHRVPVLVRPSPAVRLLADSDQIEQLIINLVRNAVDASLETGGSVVIAWQQADAWLELSVDDEGRGLPETSNLFVPFFTTKPHGSGIGLALSRQIAEAHRGSVTLEHRVPGPGCRAVVRLPLGEKGAG